MVRLPFGLLNWFFDYCFQGKAGEHSSPLWGKGERYSLYVNKCYFLQADFLVRFIGNVKIKNHLSNLGIMLYLQAQKKFFSYHYTNYLLFIGIMILL